MTDADLAARVQALIDLWRRMAKQECVDRAPGWVGAEATYRSCADDLEAALAAALAPNPENPEKE